MIFHSLDFILFLPAVLAIYWAISHKAQQFFLLAASYFFYGYIHPWFLYLILSSTLVDFASSLAIVKAGQREKKLYLFLSLLVNLGLLAVFKYFGFFVSNVNMILGFANLPHLALGIQILLPVGISFYTFQSMSYTIDVYRGEVKPCRNIIDFAIYVGFFPQLVAGPIERAGRLLPQIQNPRTFNLAQFQDGIFLLVWGFFKKLVVADNVAPMVDNIFNLENPPFAVLWVGVFAFSIQILADFSAYTDIARGSAKMLGINLSHNFNHPYIARSPSDFWRRWHISLSNWIRDYVYIPLGGSRVTKGRYIFNVLLTFFLCGLWHGASWNFALWGVYHGVLIICFRLLENLRSGLSWVPRFVQISFMFVLTNIGWLIFRESDLTYLIKYMSLSPFADSMDEIRMAIFMFSKTFVYSIPIWLHVVFDMYLRPFLQKHPTTRLSFHTASALILFVAILTMRSDILVDFIYFQF
ncbi:MAG: MBOAT family protein [Magnetococcales bacterium]|nr:MBOAT family protein [Magnetococcales bacterium]